MPAHSFLEILGATKHAHATSTDAPLPGPQISTSPDPPTTDQKHLHKCYECILNAKKGSWKARFLKTPKFITRFPTWETFATKANKNINPGLWMKARFGKYHERACRETCTFQGTTSSDLILLPNLINRCQRMDGNTFL